MRSIISKQNDRVYVGFQRVCKVYDSFFVLRCYNCQSFGHHSKECTETAVCGHCGNNHQTRNCDRKADAATSCCSNCKKAGLSKGPSIKDVRSRGGSSKSTRYCVLLSFAFKRPKYADVLYGRPLILIFLI